MSDRAILVDNIDKIHTTEIGIDRIQALGEAREVYRQKVKSDCSEE